MNNWLQKIAMGLWEDIENASPISNNDFLEDWHRRQNFTQNYAWAVPTRQAIAKLQEFVGNDQVLEVGAGKGAWAKLIQDAGINLVATDSHSGVPLDAAEDVPSEVHPENKYWPADAIPPEVSRETFTRIYTMDAEEAVNS
ncbi:MAG: class I SAM-dependent methyltransferase, partial [Asgard group archaeon]|nr:class I SAM-dependent methyltransferase [Asgard group archaeon]